MIPKRIYQTWKTHDLPTNFQHWSSTFRDLNPTYEYNLLDDAANRKFVQDNFPWFIPVYDSFPAEIYRVDAVRYLWLYVFGGVYADLDTECLKSLDPLMELSGVVLGRMGTDPNFEHSIPNAIMLSSPGEDFWLLVISLIIQNDKNQRPEYVTGPVVLKKASDIYEFDRPEALRLIHLVKSKIASPIKAPSEITVLPSHLLFPLDWSDCVHERLRVQLRVTGDVLTPQDSHIFFPKSYTVTYWSHTWEEQCDS